MEIKINLEDPFYDNLEESLYYSLQQSVFFGDYDNIAFIENEEDERFWKYIFKQLNPNIKIEFHSHFKRKNKDNEDSVAQGKQQVLKFKDIIIEHNGAVLICIDSDFDYILNHNINNNINNNNINNNNINNNPYILQTYVYSVENYSCCAKSLNELCSDLLFPEGTFDFVKFYSNFSEIINDLFVYHIILKHKNKDEDSKIKQVYRTVISEIEEIKTLDDCSKLYSQINLINNVKNEIERIKKTYTSLECEFSKIKTKLESDEKIINNMLHMYINGHLVYDLTCNILKKFLRLFYQKK